jgi:hypothetical protein
MTLKALTPKSSPGPFQREPDPSLPTLSSLKPVHRGTTPDGQLPSPLVGRRTEGKTYQEPNEDIGRGDHRKIQGWIKLIRPQNSVRLWGQWLHLLFRQDHRHRKGKRRGTHDILVPCDTGEPGGDHISP